LGVIVIHVKPALFPTFVQDDAQPASPTSAASGSSSMEAAAHGDDSDAAAQPQLDPRTAPQKILDELQHEEHLAGLGVRFVMAEKGMRIEC
jgi:hypothetical protein